MIFGIILEKLSMPESMNIVNYQQG